MIPSSSSSLSVPGSHRPPSSLSQRPPSSLSSRPGSSASIRPNSRISQRPHSRHARSRIVPFCQTLVTQITGLKDNEEDGDNYRIAVDFAAKNLEATTLNKGAAGVDMGVMDRQIRGHALKARINSQDALSEALEASYKNLKDRVAQTHDLDEEIKMSRLPDHLQFLVKLSLPPSPETLAYAEHYLDILKNPPSPPKALTWKDILAEEPFEGEHWEGVYGLPPGSVRTNHTVLDENIDGWDSTPSLSPLNSEDLELDADDSFSSLDYEEEPPQPLPSPPSASNLQASNRPPHTYTHRKTFEELQARQYWRDEWRNNVDTRKRFDPGDASTLAPTLRTVLARERSSLPLEAFQQERYIDEQDAVREILMALQGRKNMILTWKDGSFSTSKLTPRLIHLSLSSQESIVSSFAHIATTVQHLRHSTASIFSQSQLLKATGARTSAPAQTRKSAIKITRTLEAFADAVDHEVRAFDRWCAGREEKMCRAQAGIKDGELVVSLLSTEKAVRDAFEQSFDVLLDVVTIVLGLPQHDSTYTPQENKPQSSSNVKYQPSVRWTTTEDVIPTQGRAPSVVSALLLDKLFENVQEHLERGDGITSEALMRVFVKSAEPVWGMIGKWLRDGMGLGLAFGHAANGGRGGDELDDEFFIEGSGLGLGMMGLGLLDPEFWAEGYALREGVVLDDDDDDGGGGRKRAIPLFLDHIAEPVLGAGKAIGLLRALGVPSPGGDAFKAWRSFSEVVAPESKVLVGNETQGQARYALQGAGKEHEVHNGRMFSVSIDTLSQFIYEGLSPQCEAAGSLLVEVLVHDCALWEHLITIEDLFLMRRGDAMSHFTDVLFAKMDTGQSWGDFHFLNTAFNDVVEAGVSAGTNAWVRTSLVRLSFRGSKDKDKTVNRTVKAIDGLLVEYAVPFPLTYIFPPKTITIYGEILVFLLQIRRAKSVLERILIRGEGGGRGERLRGELKVFYALRSRLSWFINTLLNFLTTYVVHTQVVKFHEEFKTAKSLDEMIRLHDEHLEKVQGRCLLKANTLSLHRAILSILDISLNFSDTFVAFAGDTTMTHDVSRHSISIRRHHRSRRLRRQRRNVIGFSQSLQESHDSSDDTDDSDEGVAQDAPEPSYSLAASTMSSTDGGFHGRMDKMSSELDGLVRFVRRGVESLAGGTGEAAPAFGVLAFALEDWDN